MLGLYVHAPHASLVRILAIRVAGESYGSSQSSRNERAQHEIPAAGCQPFSNCIQRNCAVLLRRGTEGARLSLQRLQAEIPKRLRVGSSQLANLDSHFYFHTSDPPQPA